MLAQLVRERQDLVREWQTKTTLLIDSMSQAPDKRKVEAESELRNRLSTIDIRVNLIGKTLTEDFPAYVALVGPEPLAIAETQALLAQNEALVLSFDTPAVVPLLRKP